MPTTINSPVFGLRTDAHKSEWPQNLFLKHAIPVAQGMQALTILNKERDIEVYRYYMSVLAGLLGKKIEVHTTTRGKGFLSHHTIVGNVLTAGDGLNRYIMLGDSDFESILNDLNPIITLQFK